MGGDEDLVEQVVPLAGRDVVIVRPRDSESLIDECAFRAPEGGAFGPGDEFIPYWADLWPSAELLARTIAGRALRGARVLELGCGLGLPSVVAAMAGGRVLASDWSAHAVDAVAINAARNDVRVDVVVCRWEEPEELLARGPWDLVLAADVLYERRNVAPLHALLDRLACETWLADPGRAPAETLLFDLEMAGWARSELARTTSPQVTVHRLVPSVR